MDTKVFEDMISVAEPDQTRYVDKMFGPQVSQSDEVHSMLQTLGFVPAVGNLFDVADAILYAAEGEWGQATISGFSALPAVGHYVSGAKVANKARKRGEEMVTLYRGVDKWHPGKMVHDGKWVGGGQFIGQNEKALTLAQHGKNIVDRPTRLPSNALWVTQDKNYARIFRHQNPKGIVLEFQVPKSFLSKNFTKTGTQQGKDVGFFHKGLPTGFLTKVHKSNIK